MLFEVLALFSKLTRNSRKIFSKWLGKEMSRSSGLDVNSHYKKNPRVTENFLLFFQEALLEKKEVSPRFHLYQGEVGSGPFLGNICSTRFLLSQLSCPHRWKVVCFALFPLLACQLE